MGRAEDLDRLYEVLDEAEARFGGRRHLDAPALSREVPKEGVYFFFEEGETRAKTGRPRVVRVGTHGVSLGSQATLPGRLAQHRGSLRSGGGNHRGSIFRLLVGEALQERGLVTACRSWNEDSPSPEDRARELELECRVSEHLRHAMSFIWLPVTGPAGPQSERAKVERNCIALLSNWERHGAEVMDPASPTWLGASSRHDGVHLSGLWNCRHVSELHDPAVIRDLEGFLRPNPVVLSNCGDALVHQP